MIEEKAKQAAQARAEMQAALVQCANVLQQLAEALTTTATELAQAAEREQQATLAYVTELESKLSQQRALN